MDKVTQEIARLIRAPTLTLRAVRSVGSGTGATASEVGLPPGAGMPEGRRRADEWQRDFDEDADPVRVYVVDGDGVAVYAACAAQRHARKGGRR